MSAVGSGIFSIGLVTIFLPVAEKFAGDYEFASVGKFLFIGIIGTNFLFELLVNVVLVPVVKRVLSAID